MMNNIFRHSLTPISCLFVSQIYDTSIKQQRKQQSLSSTNAVITNCDANIKIQTEHQHPTIVHGKGKSISNILKSNVDKKSLTVNAKVNNEESSVEKDNDKEDHEPFFHNLFPIRQLWKPRKEYPLWDDNWDGRQMDFTGVDKQKEKEIMRFARKNGITRHIILIRHGQYDETHKEDEKRILTALGRTQADLTGQRLAEMMRGFDEQFGPCNIKTIRVSGMTRAQETADIIAKHLPGTVVRAQPDPDLNEGKPCHNIPGGKASNRSIKKADEDHNRIETAFKKYFYRSDYPLMEDDESLLGEDQSQSSSEDKIKRDDGKEEMKLKPHPQHEFEIIVCHANVIRYFLCRALQIPPEAWLRLCTFNCSLTYLTIRPGTGTVSCRMLGDIGHLGIEHSTFSMHHGFNW